MVDCLFQVRDLCLFFPKIGPITLNCQALKTYSPDFPASSYHSTILACLVLDHPC